MNPVASRLMISCGKRVRPLNDLSPRPQCIYWSYSSAIRARYLINKNGLLSFDLCFLLTYIDFTIIHLSKDLLLSCVIVCRKRCVIKLLFDWCQTDIYCHVI